MYTIVTTKRKRKFHDLNIAVKVFEEVAKINKAPMLLVDETDRVLKTAYDNGKIYSALGYRLSLLE